jgi:hypothetical protein
VGVAKERPEARKGGDWGKGKRMVQEMTKGFGEGERRAPFLFFFFLFLFFPFPFFFLCSHAFREGRGVDYETIEEEEGTGDCRRGSKED